MRMRILTIATAGVLAESLAAQKPKGCKDGPTQEVDHFGGCRVCPAEAGEACRPLPRDIIHIGPQQQPKRRGGWAGRKRGPKG